jgi:hypothetical protein
VGAETQNRTVIKNIFCFLDYVNVSPASKHHSG